MPRARQARRPRLLQRHRPLHLPGAARGASRGHPEGREDPARLHQYRGAQLEGL